jgi:hypothetical protein
MNNVLKKWKTTALLPLYSTTTNGGRSDKNSKNI